MGESVRTKLQLLSLLVASLICLSSLITLAEAGEVTNAPGAGRPHNRIAITWPSIPAPAASGSRNITSSLSTGVKQPAGPQSILVSATEGSMSKTIPLTLNIQ